MAWVKNGNETKKNRNTTELTFLVKVRIEHMESNLSSKLIER